LELRGFIEMPEGANSLARDLSFFSFAFEIPFVLINERSSLSLISINDSSSNFASSRLKA